MSTVSLYEYPEFSDAPFVPSWNGWEETAGNGPGPAGITADNSADMQLSLEEERHRAFEAGRARGVMEGRESEKATQAAQEKVAGEQRLRQAAALVTEFGQQSRQYFESIEPVVVKLALAISARILRREAQFDPLLLFGAARVALGQVAASTEVRLVVPKKDLQLWEEAIALLPNLACKAELIGKEGLQVGECLIETSLGKARLGVGSQLEEIEHALLERHSATDDDGDPAQTLDAGLREGNR